MIKKNYISFFLNLLIFNGDLTKININSRTQLKKNNSKVRII